MQSNLGWSARARKAVAVFTVCAVTATSIVVTFPPNQSAQAATSWLAYLNEYRAASGLPAVSHNTAWDQGTYNHSCYMNQNGLTHIEQPGKPGYTAAGAEAGSKSNVAGLFNASGNTITDAQTAIDSWMAAPYHAIGMLRPRWTSTSLGLCYTAGSSPRYSATLDILRGVTYATQSTVFPGNGATTHLYRFTGETPNPTQHCNPSAAWGLPLIAMFANTATNASATVSGPGVSWSSQLCVLDYQDVTDPNASSIMRGQNAVIVIPPAHLADGGYTASVNAGGQSITWSFTVKTSRPPNPTPPTPPTPPSTSSTTTTTTSTTRPPVITVATVPPTTSTTTTTSSTTTTSTTTTTVNTIAKQAPVVKFTPNTDQYIRLGDSLSFDSSGSWDPDGGSIKYEWKVTGVPGVASRDWRYRHTFKQAGQIGVELTVIDDEGQRSTRRINVFVTDLKPPIATFTPGTEQQVTIGQSITFNGSGSKDPDGGRVSYEWRATGRGIVSTSSGYTHKFDTVGRTGIEMTVIDDEGDITTKHIDVWVSEPRPPIAAFTPGTQQQVTVGQSITFDGSGSKDPDGGRVTYEWRATGRGIVSTSSGYTHRFDTAGRTGIELTIIDDEGQIDKKHIDVWASAPQPPIATFTPRSDQRVRVNQTLTFNGSGSRDPDGGTIRYEWRTSGGVLVSTSSTYSHKFRTAGRTGIELTVIDDEGQISKKHIDVWAS